jgi:glycosyltransferase involved in cell wall biosynthesis
MQVSLIIPVLNSHEIVRRQVLHFEKMGIPDDTEILLIDDGSTPPITVETDLPLAVYHTNDFREWTWPLARNKGAELAKGEYFIMADLDHIVTREIINAVREFSGDFMRFHREFAVLDEEGELTQDRDVLRTYGLPDTQDVKFTPHRNQFAIHRDFYKRMGGFREDRIGLPYPQREDGDFAAKWRVLHEAGEVRDFDEMHGHEKRPTLYMFPNGKYCGDVDHNPFGLFHTLSRKTAKNRFYAQK